MKFFGNKISFLTIRNNSHDNGTKIVIPKSHSKASLDLQANYLKGCKGREEVRRVYLCKGRQFLGLHPVPFRDLCVGTRPIYDITMFVTMPDSDKAKWRELARDGYTRVGVYKLLDNIYCNYDLGLDFPGYLVHPLMLDILYTKRVDDFLLDYPDKKSSERGFFF